MVLFIYHTSSLFIFIYLFTIPLINMVFAHGFNNYLYHGIWPRLQLNNISYLLFLKYIEVYRVNIKTIFICLAYSKVLFIFLFIYHTYLVNITKGCVY